MAADLPQGITQSINVFGGKTQKRIIKHEQSGTAHNTSGENQHTLLSTTEILGELEPLVGQNGKEVKNKIKSALFLLPRDVGSHLEVLHNAHQGKGLHALGHIYQTATYNFVNLEILNVLALVTYFSQDGAQ